MQPACQLLWFTGNYLDFVKRSVFQRLQPAQPLAERDSLNSGAKAGLWEWQWPWRDPLFRPIRWTWLPYFVQPEVTDRQQTKISWEEKMRVCHPKKSPLGLSSGTEGTWPILGRRPRLCLPRRARRQLHQLCTDDWGRQLHWELGLWSEPNPTAKGQPVILAESHPLPKYSFPHLFFPSPGFLLTNHFISKAFSDYPIEKNPPPTAPTLSFLLLVFILLHFTYSHLSFSLLTCLCSAFSCYNEASI